MKGMLSRETGRAWIRANGALSVAALLVLLFALIPLYGILFPPLTDLPEHILVSKLLWEKLSGASRLDLQISWFLGYRLFPALMMVVMPVCKLFSVSFVYLPKIAVTILISIHALVVTAILWSGLKTRSWGSYALAACFATPAVICMYSACWFNGFVNYTLAITLVISAIFFTERFLRSGKPIDASFLFVNLALVYIAHPFAVAMFWVLWCCGRGLAAVVTGSILREWKRLIVLPLLFLPIVLYHYFATRGTALEAANHGPLSGQIVLSLHTWYQERFRHVLDGTYFRADSVANSTFFARVAIGLILASPILAFFSTPEVRRAALSSVFLIIVSSFVNDSAIPVPNGSWLAYDYRFGSTVYAIGLAVTGMVLIRLISISKYKVVLISVASVSILASVSHVIEVRKAYTRFDTPARKYVEKVLEHEPPPAGVSLPLTPYHRDSTYLKNYVCLKEPDCNPSGTSFFAGWFPSLYPVSLKRSAKVSRGPLLGYWKLDERNANDRCIDSSGNGNDGIPHGTTVVEGKIDQARGFRGNGDYISLPVIPVSPAITVSAWVYSESFWQTGSIVAASGLWQLQWSLFFEAGGFLKWRGGGNEQNLICPQFSDKKCDSNWHHIVGKQEGTMGHLYLDGGLCASGNLPEVGNATTSLTIGGYKYFNGRIDEVRIYNRALSDAEIAQLYEYRQQTSW